MAVLDIGTGGVATGGLAAMRGADTIEVAAMEVIIMEVRKTIWAQSPVQK
jgi:hypothetical protein